MSQENSTPEQSQETRKKIAAGALFAIFLGVIYYQFFSGGDEPRVTRPAVAANPAAIAQPTPGPRPTPRAGGSPEPIVSQPLNLASMSTRATSGDGTGRNIFVYPPPPPPPTPRAQPAAPPPPPPPVVLASANPAGVIARTADFNLTIFGEKIPPDGKVYVDGREYLTTFISANEIRARVSADAIRNAGNVGVMVRSVSDAKLFSNQISLNVAEPPPPPYRYIGLIVRKSGATAVLKSQTDDEVINVSKDFKFKQWRVVSITPQKIILEDTNIKVTHTINFTGETG
jgi:hypothetical protein